MERLLACNFGLLPDYAPKKQMMKNMEMMDLGLLGGSKAGLHE